MKLTTSLIVGASLLSLLGSAAQASWSQPVYNVTNRKPAFPPRPADVPFGDASDKQASGTVTATFTWTHDVAGDSPPPDVYILQYGHAEWLYNATEDQTPGELPRQLPQTRRA